MQATRRDLQFLWSNIAARDLFFIDVGSAGASVAQLTSARGRARGGNFTVVRSQMWGCGADTADSRGVGAVGGGG